MGSSALSFTVAIWLKYFLMCGILHTGIGIPLSDFYPFGASENDFTVGPTDDGSNSTMLDQEFPFFDEMFDLIYINNNGIISFNHSFYDYLPKDFPLSSNRSLVAPFWADSDTYNSGTVWFGIRNDNFNLLEKASQDVRRCFSSQHNFDPNFLFVSTWEEVPHYSSGNKANTYQCVLVSDGDSSFAFFHYADGMIEWTTGDESGGMDGLGGREAEIGYDAGDGVNYHSIYLSGTPEIINIASTSNVNRSGVWVFRLDLAEDPVESCISHDTINVAVISIIVASIVVVLLISILILTFGVYCIRKWKKDQVSRRLNNSAHMYEEVERNIEMDVNQRKDMPNSERYGEIENVDINMNECVAYAVTKT